MTDHMQNQIMQAAKLAELQYSGNDWIREHNFKKCCHHHYLWEKRNTNDSELESVLEELACDYKEDLEIPQLIAFTYISLSWYIIKSYA